MTAGRRFINARAILAGAAAAAGAIFLGVKLFPVAKVFLAACILAFLIRPMAAFFEKHMKRGLAIASSFLILLMISSAVMALVVLPAAGEITRFPQYLQRGVKSLEEVFARTFGTEADLMRLFRAELFPDAESALRGFVSGAGNAASVIAGVMVVLALSWFLLLDWETFSLRMLLIVPSGLRKKTLCALSAIRRDLGGYLRAQGTLMAIVGAMTVGVLMLIGTPMPLAMGAMYALLNAVPYFGPLIGIIPPVLSAFAVSGMRAILTFSALIVIQQIDNYVLSPRIMGAASGAGAATVLIAITAGNYLFGVAGMFLAVPVLIAAKAVYRAFTAPAS